MELQDILKKDDVPSDVKKLIEKYLKSRIKHNSNQNDLKSLLESEEKNRTIIENLRVGVYRTTGDPHGSFIQINPAIVKMFGYDSVEALMKVPVSQLYVNPDNRNSFLDEIFKKGFVKNKELLLRKKDSTHMWVSCTAQIHYDKKGKIEWVDGILEDITESKDLKQKQKIIEEELRESQKMLQSVMNSIPQYIFWKDRNSVYLGCNENFARIAGVGTPENIVGKTDNDLSWKKGEIAKYLEDDRKIIETGKPVMHNVEFRETKGHKAWLDTCKIPLYSTEGTILGILGLNEDITERMKAEETLRESEARYRSLFEESPISLWEEDFSKVKDYFVNLRASGVTNFREYFDLHPEAVSECASLVEIIAVNQATLDLYKVHSKDEVSDILDKIKFPSSEESFTGFKEELIALAEGKTKFKCEATSQSSKGDKISYRLGLAVPVGSEESLSRVLISILDMTAHKQTENALRIREARYRNLFEDSPISLWEEDFSEIKRFFDDLKQSGVKDFKEYFDNHPEDIVKCTSLVKVIDVNQATLELYKAKNKEELTGNLDKVLDPSSFNIFIEGCISLFRGKYIFKQETINRTLTGEKIYINLGFSVSSEYEKSLSRVLVSALDITARKHAEKALREREVKYRSIFEESPISLWEEDFSGVKNFLDRLKQSGVKNIEKYFEENPDAVINCISKVKVIDVNQATLNLYKTNSKQELLGNLDKVFLEDSYDTFKEEIIAFAEGKTEFRKESINGTLRGDKIHINLGVSVPAGYEDTLSKVLVSIVDISALKRAEQASRERESRYRSLFEESPISLWEEDFSQVKVFFDSLRKSGVKDFKAYFTIHPEAVTTCAKKVKVIDVNQATVDLYKAESREDLLGNLDKTFAKETFGNFIKELVALAEGKGMYKGESIACNLKGEKIIFNLRVVVPSGYEDSLSRVLVSVFDLTTIKQAEEVLKKQKEEIELYLDILAHDLVQYHITAKAFMDMVLEEKSPLTEDITDLLKQTRASVVRAIDLTNNISILMRSELAYTYSLQPINLIETTQKVHTSLNERWPEKIIIVNNKSIPKNFYVLADSLFEQLLLNILSNGVKSDSSEIVKLEISVKKTKKDKCQLTITDYGYGIRPDLREDLFERYQVFTTTGKGSGLGLFIIKTLVDRYQGRIWIESRLQNDYTKGTKFNIEIKTANVKME
ncbi:MAG: PAS domain-containing sensor histidine kinase [Candidatus Hodarchaeales archaeon]|jgi:PAS domain S-box-containing protein